jgi:hypothetical protein
MKQMKKARTNGGHGAYYISIRTIFTFNNFATALAEHSFAGSGIPINFELLKKSEAIKILKHRFEYYGRNGQDDDLADSTEEYNKHYRKAVKWVSDNYPYLKTKEY